MKNEHDVILLYKDCRTSDYDPIAFQECGVILRFFSSKEEFVTHSFHFDPQTKESVYHHGHYFYKLEDATKDFKKRVLQFLDDRINVLSFPQN
ncbi:unnamed protein product [marine sediment metagenome]|uniref:Uncharacterized protein n=1 Tax=marine sediment metagenome TaxID=412755 RepID=X1FJN6_9ZZZZ